MIKKKIILFFVALFTINQSKALVTESVALAALVYLTYRGTQVVYEQDQSGNKILSGKFQDLACSTYLTLKTARDIFRDNWPLAVSKAKEYLAKLTKEQAK